VGAEADSSFFEGFELGFELAFEPLPLLIAWGEGLGIAAVRGVDMPGFELRGELAGEDLQVVVEVFEAKDMVHLAQSAAGLGGVQVAGEGVGHAKQVLGGHAFEEILEAVAEPVSFLGEGGMVGAGGLHGQEHAVMGEDPGHGVSDDGDGLHVPWQADRGLRRPCRARRGRVLGAGGRDERVGVGSAARPWSPPKSRSPRCKRTVGFAIGAVVRLGSATTPAHSHDAGIVPRPLALAQALHRHPLRRRPRA